MNQEQLQKEKQHVARLEADLERVRGELKVEIEALQSGQTASDNELSSANNQLKLQVNIHLIFVGTLFYLFSFLTYCRYWKQAIRSPNYNMSATRCRAQIRRLTIASHAWCAWRGVRCTICGTNAITGGQIYKAESRI
jgi:hypothetical protein